MEFYDLYYLVFFTCKDAPCDGALHLSVFTVQETDVWLRCYKHANKHSVNEVTAVLQYSCNIMYYTQNIM